LGKRHQINEHQGFNNLLVSLCSKYLLDSSNRYMMDYDGHIVDNTKTDNRTTYKQTDGYYPVMCSINKLPVYMQNRNGNTPESYNQAAIIKAAIDNCKAEGIEVNADACCFEKRHWNILKQNKLLISSAPKESTPDGCAYR